jgi:hypothetical protein
VIWNLCKAALRQHVGTLQHDVLIAKKIADVPCALGVPHQLHRSTGMGGKWRYPLVAFQLSRRQLVQAVDRVRAASWRI